MQIDVSEIIDEMGMRLGQAQTKMAQDAVVIRKLSEEVQSLRKEKTELIRRLDAADTAAMAAGASAD